MAKRKANFSRFPTFLLTAAALLVTAFVLLSPTYFKNTPHSSSPSGVSENNSVRLVLDFGDGETQKHSQNYQRGETAYSILVRSAEENDIQLKVQQYDFGVFVSSINGYESTPEISWIYFVNGTSGNVAADKHYLEPGDVIEWRYIPPTQE